MAGPAAAGAVAKGVGGGIGTAGGTAAADAGASSSAGQIFGAALSNTSAGIDIQTDPTVTLSRVINIPLAVRNAKMQRLQYEKQVEQFDRTFEENNRRFGLEFALRDWATRKNISLQEARQKYNMAMGILGAQQTGASLRSSLESADQSRMIQEKRFQWMKEDREKAKRANIAFSRGIAKGLLGKA